MNYFGVVRITFGSVWMILNADRAIIAGWGFQLNGDITGKYCHKSVDLVEFSVTSIPKQNNILCLGVIPKETERKKISGITCQMVMPLLAHPNVVADC